MTFRVYFQDLSERMQLEITAQVRAALLASGDIEYPQEDETETAFERRACEAVDHYLNVHNLLTISL